MLQGIKNRIAGVRDGVVIRHNALGNVFGSGETWALYGLVIIATYGTYAAAQNASLNHQVVKLTAERDLMAHKVMAVVDEYSNLHDKFRKIEAAQVKEAKRLDDLTAKLVAMSTPKPADDTPVKSGPQTQATPAEAIVATTVASVAPSPSRRWYYLWLR